MTLSVSCPECGKTLKAKSEMAGKRVRCPKCQQAFVLTEPDSAQDTGTPERDSESDQDFPDLSESLGRREATTADDDHDLAEFPTGASRKPATRSPAINSAADDLAQFRTVKPRTRKPIETIPDESPPPKKRARFRVVRGSPDPAHARPQVSRIGVALTDAGHSSGDLRSTMCGVGRPAHNGAA